MLIFFLFCFVRSNIPYLKNALYSSSVPCILFPACTGTYIINMVVLTICQFSSTTVVDIAGFRNNVLTVSCVVIYGRFYIMRP